MAGSFGWGCYVWASGDCGACAACSSAAFRATFAARATAAFGKGKLKAEGSHEYSRLLLQVAVEAKAVDPGRIEPCTYRAWDNLGKGLY